MGEKTAIEWCRHTFNSWWGCWKISPGCKHCYALTLSRSFGFDIWGPNAPRRVLSESYWKQPVTWNREAREEGRRRRVFCASMADVFEDYRPRRRGELPANLTWDVEPLRWRLWDLIERTPWLDWLLLTKRPKNIERMIPGRWTTAPGALPRNVWFGISAESQEQLETRWPILEAFGNRYRPSVLFLSLEPLLEPIDLSDCLTEIDIGDEENPIWTRPVDWVIVGGESGPKARTFDLRWASKIIADCGAAGVPVFMKQVGSAAVDGVGSYTSAYQTIHSRGGDPLEWPEALRVREVPVPDKSPAPMEPINV